MQVRHRTLARLSGAGGRHLYAPARRRLPGWSRGRRPWSSGALSGPRSSHSRRARASWRANGPRCPVGCGWVATSHMLSYDRSRQVVRALNIGRGLRPAQSRPKAGPGSPWWCQHVFVGCERVSRQDRSGPGSAGSALSVGGSKMLTLGAEDAMALGWHRKAALGGEKSREIECSRHARPPSAVRARLGKDGRRVVGGPPVVIVAPEQFTKR